MRPDAIIKTLEDAGFEARYVGGCVRDTLLDRPIHDWDIASQALPEDVLRLFPHCVPTGIRARHRDRPSGRRQRRGHNLPGLTAHITMAATPMGCALCAVSRRIWPAAIFRSTPWRWTRAARSPTSLGAGRIFPAASSAASASRKRASGRMRFGCCARTALPRSSAFHWTRRRRRRSDAARRSARRSPASGCGRRRRRRFCPTGPNILAVCWPKDFWAPAYGGKCRFFRAFRPAKNAGGQMDSRKAALSGVRPGGVPPAREALPFD